MAASPVFEQTCVLLEQRSDLDRLAVRGTVRLALKSSGLDVASVDAEQMEVVLHRVLPAELRTRGVGDADVLCDTIATELSGMTFEVTHDRARTAARAIARFGD